MSEDNAFKLAQPGEFCDALTAEVLWTNSLGDEPGRRGFVGIATSEI
jgi:hypothetical protein